MPVLGFHKEVCKRGHIRAGNNLIVYGEGRKQCRECKDITNKDYVNSEYGKEERKTAQIKYKANNMEMLTYKRKKRVQEAYSFVVKLKDVPCLDCGNKFLPCAMDFDHVRGIKKYSISQLVTAGATEGLILEEVEKCELVCANCHRVRTQKRWHLP